VGLRGVLAIPGVDAYIVKRIIIVVYTRFIHTERNKENV